MKNSHDTGPHRFPMPAWVSCAPFEALLGMEIVSAEKGTAVLTMPFRRSLAQGAGLIHGGALMSLADTALVMAIKSVVEPGTHFATIAMQSRFLHPVKKGVLRARATLVGRSGAVLKGRCDVYDDGGRGVMTFWAVFKIARDAVITAVCFEDGAT